MVSNVKHFQEKQAKVISFYKKIPKAANASVSVVNDIHIFSIAKNGSVRLPLYGNTVQAGRFTSAEGNVESYIDLNEYLLRNHSTSFLVRAAGDSMVDAGIQPGDLLIVDRSLEATSGKIVIAEIDNEYVVKYLRIAGCDLFLDSANPAFPPIPVSREKGVHIIGVVTKSISSH